MRTSSEASVVNTADAFLQAIVATPDDVATRLIYADWLEENGDPERAEFIRVQCQLSELAPGDARQSELEIREADLLARHEERWLGALPPALFEWTWRRGFVE